MTLTRKEGEMRYERKLLFDEKGKNAGTERDLF